MQNGMAIDPICVKIFPSIFPGPNNSKTFSKLEPCRLGWLSVTYPKYQLFRNSLERKTVFHVYRGLWNVLLLEEHEILQFSL